MPKHRSLAHGLATLTSGFLLAASLSSASAKDASPALHVERWRAERQNAAERGRIVVRVAGLEAGVGRLMLALYDEETPFLSFEHQLDRKRVDVSGAVTEATFENVPYGNYAIAVIYDRNRNDKLDMRMKILPAEPLGFSGGAKVGTFGPPRYKAAAFDLKSREASVRITVE